jgi:hypothetical protein
MKNILAIILSVALFAPPYVKILMYADCSFRAMLNEDSRFCDCSKVIEVAAYPVGDAHSQKQQSLEQQTDWKYLSLQPYRIANAAKLIEASLPKSMFHFHAQQLLRDIFHPPQV